MVRGVDDDREVFFEALLEGAGIDESNDHAWYLQSPGQAARLLLREGDLFDFGAGDPRALRDYPKVLADADFEHFAIQLDGEEGESAIFVTTVPEPGAFAAAASALVALALLASRRQAASGRCSSRLC